jgi:hypothetical protein
MDDLDGSTRDSGGWEGLGYIPFYFDTEEGVEQQILFLL